MIVLVALWLLFSLIVASAARQRGRSWFDWFFLSLITSPLIAGFFLLLFPAKQGLVPDPASVDDKALADSIRRGRGES